MSKSPITAWVTATENPFFFHAGERHTDRQIDRERQRQRDTRETERERETEGQTDTETDRDTEGHRETDRHTDRDRQRQRQTDREPTQNMRPTLRVLSSDVRTSMMRMVPGGDPAWVTGLQNPTTGELTPLADGPDKVNSNSHLSLTFHSTTTHGVSTNKHANVRLNS